MGRNAKAYGTKLVMTSVRMSPTIKRRLEALSEESGYTMQEHIRRALDEHFRVMRERGEFKSDPQHAKPAPPRRRPGMGAAA